MILGPEAKREPRFRAIPVHVAKGDVGDLRIEVGLVATRQRSALADGCGDVGSGNAGTWLRGNQLRASHGWTGNRADAGKHMWRFAADGQRHGGPGRQADNVDMGRIDVQCCSRFQYACQSNNLRNMLLTVTGQVVVPAPRPEHLAADAWYRNHCAIGFGRRDQVAKLLELGMGLIAPVQGDQQGMLAIGTGSGRGKDPGWMASISSDVVFHPATAE
jgi:hypothetical protein